MDIALLIIGLTFIILGIIGCFLPVIPGPPLSYAGLLLLHFTSKVDITTFTLIFTAILTIFATVMDYLIPLWGTKLAGGSKWGIRGSAIGLIFGLFTGIFGVFIFPFVGALAGELLFQYYRDSSVISDSDKLMRSLKAALGSFIGLMFGIVLKIFVCCFIAFIFVKEVIMNFF